MSIEKDIADLQEIVSELVKIVLEGQVEVQALEGALIERHGLSPEALGEYRVRMAKKQDAIREVLESATQKLARFQGPPQ